MNVTDFDLARIRDLARRLEDDEAVARQFVEDPIAVLDAHGADMTFPEGSRYRSMGELVAGLDPAARVVTLQSIATFAGKMEPRDAQESPDVLVFVFAVANANAASNANAATEVNAAVVANATANANTSGASHMVTPAAPTHRVELFDGYDESPVARVLSEMQLARPRQVALLKRAALDGDVVGLEDRIVGDVDRVPSADGVEHRVSTYRFQGRELRVESRITRDEVTILDTSMV